MNNVQLIGRLTKDVELRYFQGAQGQQAIARFTVAVDRMPKQDGTRDADFISCSCFGKRAEVISQHFQKGSKIGLTGRIRTGSYVNQQGATVYTTEVEVTDLDFIDPKAAMQPNPTTPQYNMQQGQQYYSSGAVVPPSQQPVPQQASSGAAVPPSQQPAPQQSQRGRTASTRSGNTRSSGRSAAPAQPTPAPMNQPQQEQFLDIPDGLADEGLPFN